MPASEERPTDPGGSGRRVGRDSVVLAAGSVANGLLAYVFFALTTQSLGAERAAPVAVLWSYWALAAAVLTFSVQHWVIRTMAHDGHAGTVAASLRRIILAALALSALAGLVAFAFRESLFDLDGAAFPTMVAAVTIGCLFTGLVRGALAGRGRYRATAATLAGENLLRVLVAIVVAVSGGGAQAFGLALLTGPLVGLLWLPSLRFGAPAPASAVRSPLALMTGIAGGSLLAQVVLTGAPVVLAVIGGAPAEVTSLFVALAVWRAPYLVAVGVAPQLTAALTRLVVQKRLRQLARLHGLIGLATVASAGLAALLGATLLQPVLHAIFGPDVDLSGRHAAGLAAGTVAAVGNLALLLMLLALGRSRAATGAWAAALAVSTGWLLLATMEPLGRVVLGFLLAELTAFVLLLAAARPRATRGTVPTAARPGTAGGEPD